ncbi:hypothetical protein HW555_009208 [Spodoptera exigua]|uniref:Uncharacterized protein n=1 Tax=Spodoptera exigua TaxID=7107 RepID=A0A835GDG9_SPOEX|nr:hypothetical protein HW555_009208 [Spodoptera exigua]
MRSHGAKVDTLEYRRSIARTLLLKYGNMRSQPGPRQQVRTNVPVSVRKHSAEHIIITDQITQNLVFRRYRQLALVAYGVEFPHVRQDVGFCQLLSLIYPPSHILNPQNVSHLQHNKIPSTGGAGSRNKRLYALSIIRGVSRKGNRLTSLTPKELIRSNNDARGTRDTSGVLKSSIPLYCSCDRFCRKIVFKQLNINSSGHKYKFDVSPSMYKTFQDAQQEISHQMPLMNFIQDYDVIIGQIFLSLSQLPKLLKLLFILKVEI